MRAPVYVAVGSFHDLRSLSHVACLTTEFTEALEAGLTVDSPLAKAENTLAATHFRIGAYLLAQRSLPCPNYVSNYPMALGGLLGYEEECKATRVILKRHWAAYAASRACPIPFDCASCVPPFHTQCQVYGSHISHGNTFRLAHF